MNGPALSSKTGSSLEDDCAQEQPVPVVLVTWPEREAETDVFLPVFTVVSLSCSPEVLCSHMLYLIGSD